MSDENSLIRVTNRHDRRASWLVAKTAASRARHEITSMLGRWVIAFSLLGGVAVPSDAADALTIPAQEEIEHLLVYVEHSGCEFYRNGSWYDSEEAQKHLRLKYAFLKDLLGGTEDFIEKAASRSSLSGQAYEVKCGGAAPVPSAGWLKQELMRFRAAGDHA